MCSHISFLFSARIFALYINSSFGPFSAESAPELSNGGPKVHFTKAEDEPRRETAERASKAPSRSESSTGDGIRNRMKYRFSYSS